MTDFLTRLVNSVLRPEDQVQPLFPPRFAAQPKITLGPAVDANDADWFDSGASQGERMPPGRVEGAVPAAPARQRTVGTKPVSTLSLDPVVAGQEPMPTAGWPGPGPGETAVETPPRARATRAQLVRQPELVRRLPRQRVQSESPPPGAPSGSRPAQPPAPPSGRLDTPGSEHVGPQRRRATQRVERTLIEAEQPQLDESRPVRPRLRTTGATSPAGVAFQAERILPESKQTPREESRRETRRRQQKSMVSAAATPRADWTVLEPQRNSPVTQQTGAASAGAAPETERTWPETEWASLEESPKTRARSARTLPGLGTPPGPRRTATGPRDGGPVAAPQTGRSVPLLRQPEQRRGLLDGPPRVKLRIGRLEVRPTRAPRAVQPPPPAPRLPRTSLTEYLKRRSSGA